MTIPIESYFAFQDDYIANSNSGLEFYYRLAQNMDTFEINMSNDMKRKLMAFKSGHDFRLMYWDMFCEMFVNMKSLLYEPVKEPPFFYEDGSGEVRRSDQPSKLGEKLKIKLFSILESKNIEFPEII